MNVVPLKRKIPADPICETPTYRRVTQLLEMCNTRHAMGRIVGPPGIGKSVTLRKFSERFGWPDRVVFHEVSVESGTSIFKFLSALGETMNVSAYGHSADRMRSRIMGEMRTANSAIFIIDEAQKLSATNVELLREFHDNAGCGLVLCGNSDITSRFGTLRGAAFAQIESRISYRLTLERSSEDDIRAVCEHEHIGNARTIAKLVKLGQGPLGLRMVADVVAQTRLVIGDRAITPADVEKTLAFMGVEI